MMGDQYPICFFMVAKLLFIPIFSFFQILFTNVNVDIFAILKDYRYKIP